MGTKSKGVNMDVLLITLVEMVSFVAVMTLAIFLMIGA